MKIIRKGTKLYRVDNFAVHYAAYRNLGMDSDMYEHMALKDFGEEDSEDDKMPHSIFMRYDDEKVVVNSFLGGVRSQTDYDLKEDDLIENIESMLSERSFVNQYFHFTSSDPEIMKFVKDTFGYDPDFLIENVDVFEEDLEGYESMYVADYTKESDKINCVNIVALDQYILQKDIWQESGVIYFFDPETVNATELRMYAEEKSISGPAVVTQFVLEDDIELPYITDPSFLDILSEMSSSEERMALSKVYGDGKKKYFVEPDLDYKIAKLTTKVWQGFYSPPMPTHLGGSFHGEMAVKTDLIKEKKIRAVKRICIAGLFEHSDPKFRSMYHKEGVDYEICKQFDECEGLEGGPRAKKNIMKKLKKFMK